MSDHEINLIHTGDCLTVLQDLPDESIHACVTDPPYGLNFMPNVTNGWDDFEPKEYQAWCEEWAREVKRVLKPGGHLLAFSGNRTHHRLFSGVEDAGFEIRDTLTWHFAEGFPKASDISKTIDKRADAEREVVGEKDTYREPQTTDMGWDCENREKYETEPATPEAKKWDGWKTGLKPATEFVVMARKPFDGATVDCVLDHGTGALNIDGCRIGTEERKNPPQETADGVDYDTKVYEGETVEACYPANVVFDETEAERLDSTNEHTDGGNAGNDYEWKGSNSMRDGMSGGASSYEDQGGPSRYFYTSKASKAERTLDGRIENAHPTVKPQDLMEWLVRLVTAENQIVIDPFAGSGTTCKAAKEIGRMFVGIEQQEKWADVARVRCGLSPNDPANVRGGESQYGLEEFVRQTDGGNGREVQPDTSRKEDKDD